MPAPGLNQSPFILPQMFDKPGDALQQGLALKERRDERQYEIDYRNQRTKEADDWRKLNLIRDLTDLDKYQTGEAVADAIGHQKANELFSKYTAQASSMTPAELQYHIAQDIGKTTLGMQSMKDELMQSDAMIKQLKQLHPSLDAQKLTQDYRADVLNRRIENNDFANPLKANNPSSLDLNNPDVLSDYIDVNKGLKDAVVNPKNIQKDLPVLTGSPNSYTKFTGSLPFYMKENFDRQKDFKEGFYTGKQEPTMGLKTSVVPQGAFSGANNNLEVLDKEAYNGLISENPDAEMALRKLAKTKYANYNGMSNEEKEIARRDVAKDFIEPFSKNYQFRSETATKPPHYSVNVGGANAGANLNNIYERIKQKGLQRAKDYAEGNYFDNSLAKGDLDADELEVILKGTQRKDLTPDDVKVIVEDNGRIGVYDKGNGERLVYLNQTGTNLPKQANVAGKKVSVEKGNEAFAPNKVPVAKPKKDPLKLFD